MVFPHILISKIKDVFFVGYYHQRQTLFSSDKNNKTEE